MKHIIRSARPRRRLLAAAALFLAITIPTWPVSAQEVTEPPATGEAGPEAKAESARHAIAIVNRAIEAMGGEKAIESIESARYTLKSEYRDKVVVRRAITVSPNLFLVKEEWEHGRSEAAFNGDIGWSVQVFEDTYMCVAVLPSRFRAYRQLQPWDGFTAPHRRVSSLRDSVGEAEDTRVVEHIRFNERDCWKIIIPQRHGNETIAYFDTASDLLAGIETVCAVGGQTLRGTTIYEDWQQCGPIRLSMTWRDEGDLQPQPSKTTITDFEFNTASRREIEPPPPAIEVIRVRLLGYPENERPPMLTREDINRMTIEEVRQALPEVASLRREHRGGDEAVVLWLRWEFRWLMDRLQSLQNR
jgi:hypothetical protein